MNITIEIPESYKLFFGDADIEHELKKNSALILYKQGRISLSRACELSNMNIYDFSVDHQSGILYLYTSESHLISYKG